MLQDNQYFLNASGCWAANETQLDELYETHLDCIVAKTCTLYPKTGNKEPTFFNKDGVCINSKGLPNEGYFYYKDLYRKYAEKKRFILSVSWEAEEENTVYVLGDYNSYVGSFSRKEIVELNLSCPNLYMKNDGADDTKYESREIPCYNPILFEKILIKINSLNLNNISFSLKLSPYLDHSLCNKIINIINDYNLNDCYKYVVLSNSIPNCLLLENCHPVLSNIYGGLSGKLNKYISLSNVSYFKPRLRLNTKIIGCGGIETVEDIKDYLESGASHIQLGSCFIIKLQILSTIAK